VTASTHSPRVVVGFDGSAPSRAAVRLAAARTGDGKLFIVHAYEAPPDFWGSEHYEELLERALHRGRGILSGIAGDTDLSLADVDYELELIAGRPAEVLARVAETRRADEIVVGTRGFGKVRAVLGSVAHEVLHEAPCPVTAIPARALDPSLDGDPMDRESVAG
jgi:nucleotide-binding universal stress UspA family protein